MSMPKLEALVLSLHLVAMPTFASSAKPQNPMAKIMCGSSMAPDMLPGETINNVTNGSRFRLPDGSIFIYESTKKTHINSGKAVWDTHIEARYFVSYYPCDGKEDLTLELVTPDSNGGVVIGGKHFRFAYHNSTGKTSMTYLGENPP